MSLIDLTDTAGDLRQQILRASLQIGARHEEDGLTMRTIARELGISATAIYQHFDGKAEILKEIRLLGLRELLRVTLGGMQVEDERSALLGAGVAYLGFAKANPWLYRVLFHSHELPTAELGPERSERLLVDQEALVARSMAVFGRSRSPADVRLMLASWWCALHGVTSLLIGGRLNEHDAVAPVHDAEAFAAGYLERVVDCMLLRRPAPEMAGSSTP